MALAGTSMMATGALRLLVVAIALLGTVGLAMPAAAEEQLNDAGVGAAPTGQAIADFALDYVGYPYVWAGNTPAGFDCSGFTQYVILNAVGIDIGHGVPGQTGYGAWVDWGQWQRGDLVFFANTFSAGISHVGIYIGDGQFIHAENESTGVRISSLYSDYYSGHYYGAYRIG
jgi:cell wall-associated NlpC family hydrolase